MRDSSGNRPSTLAPRNFSATPHRDFAMSFIPVYAPFAGAATPGMLPKAATRRRKNKTPVATMHPQPGKRLRQANKCIDVARRAWRTVRRLHPTVVPSECPFEGVTREYSSKETIPATREEAYALADALADVGHPSLGLAALTAFEWHQRPENILEDI